MILEEATKEAFKYYSYELTRGSTKSIISYCELCGEIRIQIKKDYRTFCQSCSRRLGEQTKGKKHHMFGKHHSEETKTKISTSEKGRKSPMKGKHHTEEAKDIMSTKKKGEKGPMFGRTGKKHPMFGRKGKKHPKWNGGTKAVRARSDAKRNQDLGYKLLLPLADGEVGHHFTDEDVIGIVAEIHIRFGGYSRKKHRALVLEWLKDNDRKKYEIVVSFLANNSEK